MLSEISSKLFYSITKKIENNHHVFRGESYMDVYFYNEALECMVFMRDQFTGTQYFIVDINA